MVEEARLEQLDAGLTPVSDGWFVVNVRDAAWVTNEALGAACVFEGDDASFPDVGFTLAVLQPGQSGGRYHREANQEDFLVLAGECLLLIEGEERPLETWDFVHCPPDTEHGFVGRGRRPVRDLHDGRTNGMAGEGHRLRALGAGAPPRCRRRDGDDVVRRGLCAVPEVAARAPRVLERVAMGLAASQVRVARIEA